jgi:riboflavin synthase
MFTGIIETLARVERIVEENTNLHITFSSSITSELKIDQSVAHNGVCLTVISIMNDQYTVTAIEETLSKTNLRDLNEGTIVNIERCMAVNSRFDGHIVQGHVDTVAICTEVKDLNGSFEFSFEYAEKSGHITVEKGSVTVNGVSLTVVNSGTNSFSVCIIPYTFNNTCFLSLKKGDRVNIEFDIIGKYVARLIGK